MGTRSAALRLTIYLTAAAACSGDEAGTEPDPAPDASGGVAGRAGAASLSPITPQPAGRANGAAGFAASPTATAAGTSARPIQPMAAPATPATPPAAPGAGTPPATPTGGRDPTMLPQPIEPCPMMVSGTVMMRGINVRLEIGPRSETVKGPIFIGWGGAAPQGRDEILAQGGVIAEIMGSTKLGTDTGNGTWYTDDYVTADQVVACSIEQLNVDTRRIWTSGHSSGGLQAGTMAYFRSGYLAAAVPSSGGISPRPGLTMVQDPSHVPSVMTMHGAMGMDVVVIDFAQASLNLDRELASRGGFAVDCDHGGGHEGPPPELRAAAWEFLKAHPFGVDPKPYAGGLPSSFPPYCKIIE